MGGWVGTHMQGRVQSSSRTGVACGCVCLLSRRQPASQAKFFPASDILGFEISRFYRGDLTGVIRGTIFVQLYKTRHEQVLDSILRSKTKILLQVPTLGVLRLGQKKRFRK